MFYEPGRLPPSLAGDPFKSCVVPRPIGWISTLSAEGIVNLAPFSFFNAFATHPPIVGFAADRGPERPKVKDSRHNAEATGAFVVNLVPEALGGAMLATSAPLAPEVDEMQAAGLAPLPSCLVAPPRVAGAPVHLECRYLKTVALPAEPPAVSNALVLGRVVGVHIDDRLIENGRVDIVRARPLARLGGPLYTVVERAWALEPGGTARRRRLDDTGA